MRGIMDWMELHPDMITAMAAARGWSDKIEAYTAHDRFMLDATLRSGALLTSQPIEAGLTAWIEAGIVQIELGLPGVSVIASADGRKFNVGFDKKFWTDDYRSQYLDDTMIATRFWFDMVMMKAFELLGMFDDDIQDNIDHLNKTIKQFA